jgi:integrase
MLKKYNKAPIKLIVRGNTYHVKISTIINGQRVFIRETTRETDRAKAETYANLRLKQIIEDIEFRSNPNKRKEFTLDQAFGLYFEEQGQNHSNPDKTFKDLEFLSKYFNPNLLISQLTNDDIFKFVKQKKDEGRKQGTINRNLAVLSAIIKICEKRRVNVPDVNIREYIKKEPILLDRYYTKDDFYKIYHAAEEHLKPIILFGLFTGFRMSNILELKWEQIKDGYIHYRVKDKSYVGGRPVATQITPSIQAILDSVPKCSDYVFTYKGQRIKSIKRSWKTAVTKAGVRYLPPHSMRHTHGTLLYEKTKDFMLVRNSLNHTDQKTTMRYVHAIDSTSTNAIESTFSLC